MFAKFPAGGGGGAGRYDHLADSLNTDNRVVTLEGSHIRYDNDTVRDI